VNRSLVDAMSALGQANPLEGAVGWWTPEEEERALAAVLAQDDAQDYVRTVVTSRPVRLRSTTRMVLIGLCILAVGSVALVLALIGSGTQSAFAAWTPTTTIPTPSQLKAATASCQSRYRMGIDLVPSAKSQLPASLPPLVVTDSRGPFELLVYAGSSEDGVCLWGSSGVISVGGSNGDTLPPSSVESIGVPAVGFDRLGESALTYAYGLAGASVTGVTLDLANGVRVETTVHNGYYSAWWPSQTDVHSAEVTASNGPRQQVIGDVGPNNPKSSGVEPGSN
jgi:hypothetical protein